MSIFILKYLNCKFSQTIIGLIFTLLLYSCIGEYVINDLVDPMVRIDNPISALQVSSTHQYTATYFNNIGVAEALNVTWLSSDVEVVQISPNGLATALMEGNAIITAQVTSESGILFSQNSIVVTTEETSPNSLVKSGIIITTSSYELRGSFTIEQMNNLIQIIVNEDYVASSSLPGLYLYLTNNPNSIGGALEVGPVEVFKGAHEYIINDVHINDYSHLLYWCKPFSVKVGEGKIE